MSAFLCLQEGIYQVTPHNHMTMDEAISCSNRWGAQAAFEREQYKGALQKIEELLRAPGPGAETSTKNVDKAWSIAKDRGKQLSENALNKNSVES